MEDPIFSELPDDFEKSLLSFCEAPAPAPAVVAELEQRLFNRYQEALLSPEPAVPAHQWWHFSGWMPRRGWQVAVIVLLVVLCAGLIAIGPQRALAQVQQWLGYLPGAGFINPDQTRVLAAPVEAHQGNSTLLVQQVVAGPDKTVVVASLQSLPEEISLDGPSWMDKVTLILPGGQRLSSRQSSETRSAGKVSVEIESSPLPEGVHQLTLEMPTLPFAADGVQQFWTVSLTLVDVRQAPTQAGPGSLPANPNSSTAPGILAVAPYTPENALASNQGVTVRLLQVAQSPQETGVLIQIDWRNPDWDFQGFGATLRDDQGRVYDQLPPAAGMALNPTPVPHGNTSAQEMLRFAPLEPGARRVTLNVEDVNFEVHPHAQFQFDAGDHPDFDKTWSFAGDPAKRFNIEGFQVQVVQADFTYAPASDQVQMTVATLPSGTQPPQPTQLPLFACRLRFMLEVTPQAHARLFVGPATLVGQEQGLSGQASGTDDHEENIFIDLYQFPTAPVDVQLNSAYLYLQGGWQIEWNLP